MRIAEIFFSIQGEGRLAGVPSVFVRTSGCNLRCGWCDTPYASWNPEGDDLSVETILKEVEKHPANHCVVTGGEPMIVRGLSELLSELRVRGKHITIETAATISPGGIPCDLASLSPKLANSTPEEAAAGAGWRERHERRRWNAAVIREWCSQYDHQLKFVVSSEQDVREIESALSAARIHTAAENILLMPQARTTEEQSLLAPRLVDWCKTRGWRYCPRLHIELFGNTRGT